jgi:ferredoxin-NADP reductase
MGITNLTNAFIKQFFHHQSLASYLEPVVQKFKPAWRANSYRAKVVSVKSLVANCLAIELKPEKKWPIHKAGQHTLLTVEMNGRLLSRMFTIASSPTQAMHEGVIRLVIKAKQGGQFTAKLADNLREGMWCNLSAPSGDFTLVESNEPVTFVAAGSGITPFVAMLHEHLAKVKQTVNLVYMAKPEQHLLVNELTALADTFKHFSFKLITRNTVPNIRDILPSTGALYSCGPLGLMEMVKTFAKQHNLPFYNEFFGLPDAKPNNGEARFFTVKLKNNDYKVSDQEPILAQLEAQNAPVKRGCGMGICHQCQCVKKQGNVQNLLHSQVADNAQQLIQLCISTAQSDLILEAE